MKQKINVKNIENNTGQIPGVPKNPRDYTDEHIEKMKKSIVEDMDMLDYREALVYKYNGKFVVIAGNLRFEAAKKAGVNNMPCKILPGDISTDKLKRIALKDNGQIGDWNKEDLATNEEWKDMNFNDWGIDVDLSSYFEPATTPEYSNDEVTEEDIEEAKDNVDVKDQAPEKQEVICPNCHHQFEIEK